MGKEERTVRFDNDLGIEAYCFKGIMLKFPNHFHEYYVIGFIEAAPEALILQKQRILHRRRRHDLLQSAGQSHLRTD